MNNKFIKNNGDWGLWIGDWGLGIGDYANITKFTFSFHFIQELLIFFLKKWKKKVNLAKIFASYG